MLDFRPRAINALGHVIGDISGEEVQLAVRWTAAEGEQDFGLPDGVYSFAGGINDLGHIVGAAGAFERPYAPRAFLWTPAGRLRDLGTLGGEVSGASAINLRGHVTGTSETSVPGVLRAFVWTPDRRG